MNRRDFLQTTMGITAAAALNDSLPLLAADAPPDGSDRDDIPSPLDTKVNIKPVLTNIVHTDLWEGPCRWHGLSPAEERKNADAAFERWSKETRELEKIEGVRVLNTAHLTFCEDFKLSEKDLRNLAAELLRRADKSFLDRRYVVKSCQFHRTVQNLMRRHRCNAFTIECFEFCSSRLPQ